MEELQNAIQWLTNRKSPRQDRITREILKNMGEKNNRSTIKVI